MSTTFNPDSSPMPAEQTVAQQVAENTPASHFLRVIWRWHFYAGLFVIPFMLMLAITGMIYLFKPQLDPLMYRDRMIVQPAVAALPYTAQLAAARAAYPDSEIASFRPSDAPDRSAEIGLTTPDGRELTVFVNPYSGSVLGERDEQNNLQYYAETLHGELMIGTTGDRLVELAACWGLVLILTGLYMWWPRKGSRIWGTLVPRFQIKNRRLFWRDMHAVPGFWGALLLAFMIITGLPWSGVWGVQVGQLLPFPPPTFDVVPQSTVLTGALNQSGEKIVPWAVEQLPLPTSEHAGHGSAAGPSGAAAATVVAGGIAPGTLIDLDSVVALALARGIVPGFTVSLPADAQGVYTVSIFPADPTQEATMHVDQYSGKVLADVRWQDYSLGPKAIEMGIALHEGKYFGLANQLLMLFACLLVISMCITGAVMWWQRRPAGRLGAPAMPRNFPLWKGALLIIAVMGVLFPLVGISLVAVLLLDYLLIARIPVLKRILN